LIYDHVNSFENVICIVANGNVIANNDVVAIENESESGAANVSANGAANANESGAVNENASDGDWAVRVRADVRILAPPGIVSPRVPVDDN